MYRRYASLFFVCGVGSGDNELVTLEVIHRYVEVLDRYFGNVSPPPPARIARADSWACVRAPGLRARPVSWSMLGVPAQLTMSSGYSISRRLMLCGSSPLDKTQLTCARSADFRRADHCGGATGVVQEISAASGTLRRHFRARGLTRRSIRLGSRTI